MASVDFPVPRMPISTMDAFGAKMRRHSIGWGIGVGVVRGVDLALECKESKPASGAVERCRDGCILRELHSALGAASPIIAEKVLFVPMAAEAMTGYSRSWPPVIARYAMREGVSPDVVRGLLDRVRFARLRGARFSKEA